MLYKKRAKFNNLLIKIGILFSRIGLTPNQWTAISIIPAIVALYFLVNSEFILAATFFIISAFLDLVDGSVARVTGKASNLGAYFDTVVDRYVEGIIVFGLLFVGLPAFFIDGNVWLFLYFFGGMMTTYVKAAAKEKNLTQDEIKGGLLERAERLIILFIGILLAAYNIVFLTYVIVLLAVLTNISAIQRLLIVVNLVKKK